MAVLLTFWLTAGLLTIRFFDGTADDGDSITHYLFARHAPQHPELFFNHWAKPFFVLLATPFAQFGFNGIKTFNLLLSCGTLYSVFLCARDLRMVRPWLAPLTLACLPQFFVLTFSGLTEPLFAFVSTVSLWLLLRGKPVAACVCLSFLPFVRSEGLIVAGVAALYLLQQKRPLVVLWLLAGTVVYSFAGWPVHGDLLWTITKIPYATTEHVYGSGNLFHFIEQLYYITGFPAYVLFWTGVGWMLADLFRRRGDPGFGILVAGSFFAFFIAHTLFWYMGIFASMGLKRVLYCILPQAALFALYGMNRIVGPIPARAGAVMMICLVIYLVVFPFTDNPAAIRPQRDLLKSAEQKNADSVLVCIRKRFGADPLVYDHQYISLALDADHFDPKVRLPVSENTLSRMLPGQLLVWDNSPSRSASEADTGKIVAAGLEEVCRAGGGRYAVFIGYRKP